MRTTKNYLLTLVLLAITACLFSACEKPDLTIPAINTGTLSAEPDGSVKMSLDTTVANVGEASAGVFKLAAHCDPPVGDSYVVQYKHDVDEPRKEWYPFVEDGLDDGDTIVVRGVVTFPSSVSGAAVGFWVEVDSCVGDEFIDPDPCRVKEEQEDNNFSSVLTLTLP
jgi:hypothetical protein